MQTILPSHDLSKKTTVLQKSNPTTLYKLKVDATETRQREKQILRQINVVIIGVIEQRIHLGNIIVSASCSAYRAETALWKSTDNKYFKLSIKERTGPILKVNQYPID